MEREQRVHTWDHWHENSAPRFPHEKAVQFTYRNYRQNPLSADFCALDLGCGNGVHTELLTDLGMSVTSVDISPVALGKTQERISARHLQQPKIIEGLLSEIDFQSHSFDLILSIGVLDYAGQAEPGRSSPDFSSGFDQAVKHSWFLLHRVTFEKALSEIWICTATQEPKLRNCCPHSLVSESG